MDFIKNYKLFLFDFDGLLVNTEHLHYRAYQKLLEKHGFELGWDFSKYCKIAHYHSDSLRNNIYAEFPELEIEEADWSVLYQEKKDLYKGLLERGDINLMSGVLELLKLLLKENKKFCVVTHSPKDHINKIIEKIPDLKIIPKWFTREDYINAKPAPDCCLKALEFFSVDAQDSIGFDDTPRGIEALLAANVKPCLITPIAYPEIEDYHKQGVTIRESLPELFSKEL